VAELVGCANRPHCAGRWRLRGASTLAARDWSCSRAVPCAGRFLRSTVVAVALDARL